MSTVPAEREAVQSRISVAQAEIQDIAAKLFGLSNSERDLLTDQLD